jgi:hypothetical protein
VVETVRETQRDGQPPGLLQQGEWKRDGERDTVGDTEGDTVGDTVSETQWETHLEGWVEERPHCLPRRLQPPHLRCPTRESPNR